jgi:ABC-type Zn uptake system ZnuABC Zn-binding protein ZnuA
MKKEQRKKTGSIIIGLVLIAIIASCSEQKPQDDEQNTDGAMSPLKVVATTTILGDVVEVIGGEHIDLDVILPPGADPHAYQITPQDVAALDDADLVFKNGLGLETFLETVLNNIGEDAEVISVSEGITILSPPGSNDDGEENADPHVWFDPGNVTIWTGNIEAALTDADPDNAETYHDNAESYREKLQELDDWIADRFEQLPVEKRLIVTDHDSLGYLVHRYGLELIGTVVPGFSTQAQPSAKELAALLDIIEQRGITAVFISDSTNSSLAEQIARDSGIRLVPLKTGSLTPASGSAPTYLDFMRLNIETITDALSAGS